MNTQKLESDNNLMRQQVKSITPSTFCVVLTILLHFASQGQTQDNIKLLRLKIQSADSIVLISHEPTIEYRHIVPDWDVNDKSMNLKKWNKLHPPPLKYLDRGKLNRKIIKESLALSDSNKINLVKILLRQVLIKRLTYVKCDEPRHSIIIYKANKESYIDICFGCRTIHTSKDIDFSEFYMDEKKWTSLKNFIKTNGLTKLFVESED